MKSIEEEEEKEDEKEGEEEEEDVEEGEGTGSQKSQKDQEKNNYKSEKYNHDDEAIEEKMWTMKKRQENKRTNKNIIRMAYEDENKSGGESEEN